MFCYRSVHIHREELQDDARLIDSDHERADAPGVDFLFSNTCRAASSTSSYICMGARMTQWRRCCVRRLVCPATRF